MKSIIPITYLSLCLTLVACQTRSNSEPQESLVEPTTAPEQVVENTPLTDTPIAEAPEVPVDDTIILPANLKILSKALGDLTKDGTDEQVFVVEPLVGNEQMTEAPPRHILVYRLEEDTWQLWQEIQGGVRSADQGGVLGDPFQKVSIERGALVVDHFGGSRIKWHDIHRFRWQNEQWQLIGATTIFGAPCDYWHTYDYNLSTGRIEAKWETENCDTEEITEESFIFRHRIHPLPNMANFVPGDLEVDVPDRDTKVYF